MSSAADQSQASAASGPPYPPAGAQLGGVPTTGVDVPISAVIIALFIAAAAANMTIFQRNRGRGHKFVLSAVVFGFCMTRIVANVMRIVWATRPANQRVVIAALIFANAGVILLFVVNLIFAQRLLRAFHPRLGWSRPATLAFRFFYSSFVACLIMVIVAIVWLFYTRNPTIMPRLISVQKAAVTYLAILAFAPLPVVLACALWPRSGAVDRFGTGRMRTKVWLVAGTAALLAFGASFRGAIIFMPRPLDQPAWFHHRALYYCLNYVIELIVVTTYTAMRFDRRFHVPNGSSAPGHYTNGVPGGEKGSDHAAHTDEEAVSGKRPRTAKERRV